MSILADSVSCILDHVVLLCDGLSSLRRAQDGVLQQGERLLRQN